MVVVSVEILAVRVPRAPALGVTVLMVWRSVRSTSVKERVPVSERSPVAVTSSVTEPMTSVVATMGASFVPVMVTVTLEDVLLGCCPIRVGLLSVALMV